MPYPRNGSQLGEHDKYGNGGGQPKSWNQKRYRMPNPAQGSHQSANQSPDPRMASPGKASIIGECFGKSHADSCTQAGCQSYQKGSVAALGIEGGSKDRGQRRDGAVH